MTLVGYKKGPLKKSVLSMQTEKETAMLRGGGEKEREGEREGDRKREQYSTW